MVKIIAGLFIVLHGLVILMYTGQSLRLFELEEGMTWPDGSWALAQPLSQGTLRMLAGIACALAALGFVLGGIGIFLEQGWWRPLVVGSAILSSITYILFWDGSSRKLAAHGGIGVLINLAILAAVLLDWPDLGFL